MPRITMHVVAERALVSPSTVSRVLNKHPRISAKTRERVLAAVEELGFRPDPGASNLVAHRWRRAEHRGTLGVALVQREASSEADRDNPVFHAAAREAGFQLDTITIGHRQELQALPRILRARGLSGALVEFVAQEEEVPPLQRVAEEFATTMSNHRQAFDIAPSVVRDAYHRVGDSLREIIKRGYRKIGLCLPQSSSKASEMLDQMEAAFLLTQKQLGRDCSLAMMLYHGVEMPELQPFLKRSDLQAVVMFEQSPRWLETVSGWRVPADIAMASMAANTPDCAGIRDTRKEVIHQSVQLLQMMIRAGQTGSSLATFRHEVRGKWQDGPSLPRL